MRALVLLTTALLATAAPHARAADADFQPLLSDLQSAWNNGDGDAWGRSFAADADSIGTAGVPIHGAKTIAARHATVFKGALKGSQMTIKLEKSRMLGANDAVIDTVQTVTRPNQNGAPPPSLPDRAGAPAGPTTVHVAMVVERRDDKWMIVHAQNTVYAPANGLLPPPKQ